MESNNQEKPRRNPIADYIAKNRVFLIALMIVIAFLAYQRLPQYLENQERINRPAPNFTARDSDGNEVTLNQLQGKIVVLNFWATWCAPCLVERPILNSIYEELGGEDFEILSITQEDPDHVRKFLEKSPINHPVILDSLSEVAALYRIRVYPTLYVIGRDGVILDINNGLDFFLKWKLRYRVTGSIF